MNPLSQRDPRWKDIKLGNSNVTIGAYGCFITCIAYLLGTTPDIVNDRLKATKDGYVQNNLVSWSKLPEAFPGVAVSHVLEPYNNDVVKANLPVLVTVDGSPIGSPLHAVVYIGNQKLMDPWTGTIEPTSKYKAQKFVVIKGKYQSNFQVDEQTFRKLVNKATQWDKVADELKIDRDDALGGNKAVEAYRNILSGKQDALNRIETVKSKINEFLAKA